MKGFKRKQFFHSTIDKLCTLLQKLQHAKVSNRVVSQVLQTKVFPTLCHCTMICRPTLEQIAKLNTAICRAATSRKCQTNIAAALFLQKTHAYDVQAAMVYQNLCFWRRMLTKLPHLHEVIRDSWVNGSASCTQKYGLITILHKDLEWLGLGLRPEGFEILSITDEIVFSLLEKNKPLFQHQVREVIRQKLLLGLQDRLPKWYGVTHVDLHHTTALFRKLNEQHPYRPALARCLTDAHCTPFRLYKMQLQSTPACPFCNAEVCDTSHIIWNCPKFDHVREGWPRHRWNNFFWPKYARSMLICDARLPEATKIVWSQIQAAVAQLLTLWMNIDRELEAPLPAQVAKIARTPQVLSQLPSGLNLQTHQDDKAPTLPLSWRRPLRHRDLMEWGGKAEDFNLLFTFWAQWSTDCDEHCTRVPTWACAFAIFLQMGGFQAHFITQSQHVLAVVFKFRTLTKNLFQLCLTDDCWNSVDWRYNELSRWSGLLPPDHTFPTRLRLPCSWDLTKTVDAITAAQMELQTQQIDKNCHYFIDPSQFVGAVQDKMTILRKDDLSTSWPLPPLRDAALVPPWYTQVRCWSPELQVTCVMQRSLQEWIDMPVSDIRMAISHVLKRFKYAQKKIGQFKTAAEDFRCKSRLNQHDFSHILRPDWSPDLQCCLSCGCKVRFGALHRRCTKPKVFTDAQLTLWINEFDHQLKLLQGIIAKFGDEHG